IGGRPVSQPALETAKFDLKPEYIGSGLGFYDKTKISGDPAAELAAFQTILATKGGGITALNFSPAQDQNAFLVRKQTADQFRLTKMSDLTPIASQLKFGVATECDANPVCGPALKAAYGIDVSSATKLAACDTPMAQALLGKTIDVGELCSTQPDIA